MRLCKTTNVKDFISQARLAELFIQSTTFLNRRNDNEKPRKMSIKKDMNFKF